METHKIFAVIPAFNEEKSIPKIIRKARKFAGKVIVVDDGSKDRTSEVAKKAGAIVLRHVVNLGKGAALKTGCDFALKNKAQYIVAIDADAQHKPEDIPRFIEKLKRYDIVFGCRKFSSKMPFVLKFGNWFIAEVTWLLYGIKLNDTQCGFRAFSGEAYKKVRWNAIDYAMESEMIARAGKQRLKYVQIPIETIYSDRYKGTTVIDGMKIVLNMIWWRILNNR